VRSGLIAPERARGTKVDFIISKDPLKVGDGSSVELCENLTQFSETS
jgi:hypothetical protein